MRVRSLEDIC
jgi:hypothetical protein